MSKLSELHADLETIRRIMEDDMGEDYIPSPEEQMERRCDALVRDLDELVAFANNPETVDLVEGQSIAVGQMLTRIQIIAGFLNARKPRLTVVSNVR